MSRLLGKLLEQLDDELHHGPSVLNASFAEGLFDLGRAEVDRVVVGPIPVVRGDGLPIGIAVEEERLGIGARGVDVSQGAVHGGQAVADREGPPDLGHLQERSGRDFDVHLDLLFGIISCGSSAEPVVDEDRAQAVGKGLRRGGVGGCRCSGGLCDGRGAVEPHIARALQWASHSDQAVGGTDY